MRRGWMAGLTLATALGGCSDPDGIELADRRADWEAAGITSYSYDLQYGCFCSETTTLPAHIVVTDGEVTDATYAQAGYDIARGDPVDENYEALTIDGLFDLADRAVREADEVTITYDDEFGFPESIDIDWITNAMDDEQGVTASNFVE